MPFGNDDYDIVIGVSVEDQTAPGSASVKNSLKRSGDDIRTYSDRQARDIARNSRTTFSRLDQDVSRSSSSTVKKLVHVFDTHNFLLRNMARQAGSITGAIAIGVGKLALSYSRLGKDVEESRHRSVTALADMKQAVARLGTDPNAFPAAILAARNLSTAYEKMGMTGHAASTRAGSALETLVHRRVIAVSTGLDRARQNFERLRNSGSADSDKLASKVNEISASVSHLLGGVPLDAPFFKSFIKARTDTEKYLLVLNKLGPQAAVAFASNQGAIDKLASAYIRLESRAAKSIKSQSDKFIDAGNKVKKYQAELTLLEKGLGGVTNATAGTTAATSKFSGAMAAGTIAGGALLAIIIAITVAIIALTIGIYKGATTAATYGNEIYKLSLSTGLTVKTLSALSVIARETNTEVDSLAKTFTRTQIQIQRGIDKPYSEAGRALRTLKVDFQELKKANPDQQVFMLAKAFTELNNQNVRATVSQQLFSRDAERQAKMLEQVANGFDVAQKKAKRFGLELDESGAVKANIATVAAQDLKMAWEGLWVTLGMKILPQLTLLLENFIDIILKTGGAFATFGEIALMVLRQIRIEIDVIKQNSWWENMASLVSPAFFLTNRALRMGQAGRNITAQDKAQEEEYRKRIEELRRRGLQGDDEYAPGKGPKSMIEQLEDRVKKLRFEIQALMNVGSREFKLRFELEDLEKAKAGFETIFKLRSDMGLVLNEPLPTFRVFGTPEEQHQDLTNLQGYVKQLERMKTVFDGVRRVANEQADSLAELARVQREALMPVVDANLRAEIKYHTAIRDRAKAEKELTADVISEARLRKDAIQDEIGSTLKAYMTLQRDLGRSRDKVREQRLEDEIFVRILKGGPEAEAAIREKINANKGQVLAPIPNELVTIATHAASIDANVLSIVEKMGVNVVKSASGSGALKAGPIGTEMSPNSDSFIPLNAINDPDILKRRIAGINALIEETKAKIKKFEETGSEEPADVIKTDTADVVAFQNRILEESKERASGERASRLRLANQEILDNQARLNEDLIDLDTDYLNHWTALQVGRRESARTTIVDIMILENDLKNLSNTNSQLYQDTWKEADKQRLDSHRNLKNEIITLENEITNNGFDESDRLTRARLQAIRDIQEQSNAARESIIYNQQIIADQTVFHADRADAAVMEFLAEQRGITEIIADAKIGVIDATFSSIDSGLDKLTAKLGIAGDIVKELISGFLRLALSPFFKAMFGSSSGGGGGIFGSGGGGVFSGGGGQGGIGSIPGVITNLTQQSGLTLPPNLSGIVGFPGGPMGIAGAQGGTWAGFGNSMQGVSPANFLPKTPSFLTSIGGALPFLGLGIGANLGGQSRSGSILGGAGGLIAGGVGAAFLAPGLFASTGVLGSMGPAALGLLTNPITAVIAGGLIVGGILLGRKKQRGKEEAERDRLKEDTFHQLDVLLNDAKRGRLDPVSARLQAQKLVDDYYLQVSQFKTGSVKKSAENFRPFFNSRIQAIVNAAINREQAEERMTRIVPEFKHGSYMSPEDLESWANLQRNYIPKAGFGLMRIPGSFDKKDDVVMRVSRGEHVAVMTPHQFNRMGGTNAFQSAGVPTSFESQMAASIAKFNPRAMPTFDTRPTSSMAFTGRGTVSDSSPAPTDNGPTVLEATFVFDGDKIVAKGLRHPKNKEFIVKIKEQSDLRQ